MMVSAELPKDFDPQAYLQLNPDVAAARANPRRHYLRFGIAEGRQYRLPAAKFPLMPMMSAAETDLLARYLKLANNYLEFGAGGSTFMACGSVSHVHSVESSQWWIGQMRGYPEIGAAEKNGQLTFAYSDIGPTKDLGFPVDDTTAARWPKYYTDVWKQVDGQALDTVLIDGRFRTACTLATIANTGLDTQIIVHDFWDRTFYHRVLDFTRVIEQTDNIVVLQRRRWIDWRSFARAVQEFALDPR